MGQKQREVCKCQTLSISMGPAPRAHLASPGNSHGTLRSGSTALYETHSSNPEAPSPPPTLPDLPLPLSSLHKPLPGAASVFQFLSGENPGNSCLGRGLRAASTERLLSFHYSHNDTCSLGERTRKKKKKQ